MEICKKHNVPFIKVHGMKYKHEKPLYRGDVEHEDIEMEECPKCLKEKLFVLKKVNPF